MINYESRSPSTERTSKEYLALNSCGIEDISDMSRGSMRKNGRVDYHILYIEKGTCYLETDGGEVNVNAGGIILFRPFEPQCYSFRAEDRSISHYIHFTGSGCKELLEKLGIADIHMFDMGVSGTYEEISAKMAREYTVKRKFWESYTVGCLYELLSLIARKYALRNDRISHESESRIGSACRRIYENLASPPTISELSAESCLSVSRFSHLFTEVVGKSPNEFIISLRIDKAKELLEGTGLSVREISESVGFADQNYFSRVFKDRTGVSPMSFRSGNG